MLFPKTTLFHFSLEFRNRFEIFLHKLFFLFDSYLGRK